MADANLFPDEASFTPRPAWQVIEAARRQYLTGELTLPTKPSTRLYLRDGVVYFAERSTDGGLPIRLMMEGVINREQMQRGTVIVNGVEHVGRMFEADKTIDRASVELCVELFTEDVMTAVSNEQVSSYDLALYRRHPSGIDRWYPQSVPVAARQSDPVGPRTTHEPEPAPAAVAPAAKPAAKPRAKAAPKNKLNAPPITQAVPITPPVTATLPVTPPVTSSVPSTPPSAEKPVAKSKPMAPPITTTVSVIPPVTSSVPMTPPVTATVPQVPQPMAPPVTSTVPVVPPPVTSSVPAVTMPSPTTQLPVTPVATPAPADELDAAAIAAEVEEAIKRVFAEMGM